jgi:hypothetical protein
MNIRIKTISSGMTALLLLTIAITAPVKVLAVTNQSIAAPLFSKPGTNSYWDDVRNAGSSSVPFVVASPNNGPGLKADPAYADAIGKNTSANVRTLGYIQTNYQTRPFKEAVSDIDNWYKFYPQTSGIYIDLLKEGGQDEACYAAALYTHVKNTHPNDLVILSPGTHVSPAYEPYGDIFVNASMDYATYRSWKVQHKGFEDKTQYQNRFWHMIYGVSQDQYSSAFADIRDNNAGWVYMTDKSAPTPFAATPAFWQNEASDVGALPESVIPNRGRTSLPRGCISLSSSADNSVDTRTAKQSTTISSVTVNNTAKGYDSEPTTSIKFMSMPKGVTVNFMRTAAGWNCDLNTKACTYNAAIPTSSSLPVIATSLTATCDYAGGDALLRLTNYTGNQWDLKVPVHPPFGCDPATAAGKLNADTGGLVAALTTQSQETTPEITPLGAETAKVDNQNKDDSKKSAPVAKTIAIVVVGLTLLGLATWGFLVWRKRRRYSVDI